MTLGTRPAVVEPQGPEHHAGRQRLVALVLGATLLSSCVIDTVDPSYGTFEDLRSTVEKAVDSPAAGSPTTEPCPSGDGERPVMTMSFPDLVDVGPAFESIWIAWSALWPDGADHLSDRYLRVTTTPGAHGEAYTDTDGAIRIDLSGPCGD